jgi:hypothetical protein
MAGGFGGAGHRVVAPPIGGIAAGSRPAVADGTAQLDANDESYSLSGKWMSGSRKGM